MAMLQKIKRYKPGLYFDVNILPLVRLTLAIAYPEISVYRLLYFTFALWLFNTSKYGISINLTNTMWRRNLYSDNQSWWAKNRPQLVFDFRLHPLVEVWTTPTYYQKETEQGTIEVKPKTEWNAEWFMWRKKRNETH